MKWIKRKKEVFRSNCGWMRREIRCDLRTHVSYLPLGQQGIEGDREGEFSLLLCHRTLNQPQEHAVGVVGVLALHWAVTQQVEVVILFLLSSNSRICVLLLLWKQTFISFRGLYRRQGKDPCF